ncbi:MAG TPA: hypothetical protein PKE12_06450 [Kiritimatiellia bacterium]|nr:hypothetical protein [Kiritimatiellia bacterium]
MMNNKQDSGLSWLARVVPAWGLIACFTLGCQVQPPASEEAPPARPVAPVAPPSPTPSPPVVVNARYLSGAEGDFGLADYKGRPVLVSVQGVGTPAFAENLKSLNAIQEEWGAQRLAVVGLLAAFAEGEHPESIANAVGAIYPLVLASPDVLGALGGIRALPSHVLLDATGAVRQSWPGSVSPDEIRAAIRALVETR